MKQLIPTTALPETDALFVADDGVIMRLRITGTSPAQQMLGRCGPLSAEIVSATFQVSICADESGRPKMGDSGPLLLSPEVHSITVAALADGTKSMEAWLKAVCDDVLARAARKARVIEKLSLSSAEGVWAHLARR